MLLNVGIIHVKGSMFSAHSPYLDVYAISLPPEVVTPEPPQPKVVSQAGTNWPSTNELSFCDFCREYLFLNELLWFIDWLKSISIKEFNQ